MNATLSAHAAYDRIVRSLEAIRSDETEVISTQSAGDVVRQGDLYLVCLDEELPSKGVSGRQLAPGSTQGSRHIAAGDCEVFTVDEESAIRVLNRLVPATRKHDRQFVGPMIRCNGPVEIDHPEHGNKVLPSGSVYLVTFQRTWANEIRRTQD